MDREIYEHIADITETLEVLTEQMKAFTAYLGMRTEEDEDE